MQRRHLTLARGAALVAALALAACSQRAADAPAGAAADPDAAKASGNAAPDKLTADTRLAFVHTANLVGELEPCG